MDGRTRPTICVVLLAIVTGDLVKDGPSPARATLYVTGGTAGNDRKHAMAKRQRPGKKAGGYGEEFML